MKNQPTPTRSSEQSGPHQAASSWAWPLLTLGLLIWSDWPAVRAMSERWVHDPRYSHALLVPAFALYLLGSRQATCPGPRTRPHWGGALVVAAAGLLQVAGALTFFGWAEGMALIVGLAGVVTLWGGLPALRWAAPALAFLIFMVPLPYRIEVALGGPLQRLGTLASTYTLQTAGLPAIAEGNIIRLDDRASIAVVEACNGLGMLAAFGCYAAAAAIVMRREGPVIRSVILLSAIPLALLANVVRITATGLAHATLGPGAADLVFHDLAGWLMMPLALSLLWAESVLLKALVVEQVDAPLISSLQSGLVPVTASKK